MALGIVHFSRDLVLLGFQEVGRECVRVIGFEELLALVLQRLDAGSMPTNGPLVQLS
ncbi:MAG: hypothetical protein WD404_02015 [Solirubrobacterales bacterium]